MELRQLQYFLAVVEKGSFTRAAAGLHVAQPGVSAQIRQLERELGQPLLDRSGRTVTPTEVGEAVLPYARAALAAVEGMRQTVEEYTGLLRGHVTLGLVSGAATDEFDLAALLADFHSAHPRVEISLTEDTSARMLTALRRGELDLAIVGVAEDEPPPDISLHVLIDTPLVAAMAPDDPLLRPTGDAERPTTERPSTANPPAELPLSALADRPLICLPRGTGIRGALERACRQAGFAPRIAFEAAAPNLLAHLAARGLGVAVLPEIPSEAAAALGLRTLPLTAPALRGRIALAWPTDGPTRPAAKALLLRMRETLGRPG
ncbi:LysR family transcriptional regulator [Streptomyces sp. NPDC012769]|uniref:LysR family transcriptional regulator n=1 Tax=Streptomyces sp. NPDC012769 TaxID=3364848 RepID=UPI00367E4C2F